MFVQYLQKRLVEVPSIWTQSNKEYQYNIQPSSLNGGFPSPFKVKNGPSTNKSIATFQWYMNTTKVISSAGIFKPSTMTIVSINQYAITNFLTSIGGFTSSVFMPMMYICQMILTAVIFREILAAIRAKNPSLSKSEAE